MLKTAVIGAGYLGTYHADKYSKNKLSSLTAIVDVDQDRGRKLAKKHRVEFLQDFAALPTLGIQCASIASDTSTHFEIASFLLQNGIDVLVEKPMTTKPEEARELIRLAREYQRVLQVGHLERFNPAFRAIKNLLTKPWFFEVRRIAPFAGRGHDVDVVLDLMIHDIDIVMHLVGSPVVRLEAVGVPVLTHSNDIANARLTFENGAVANVTASRAALKSERTIRIFQPDLYISVDFEKKKAKVYQKTGDADSRGFPKIEAEEYKVNEGDALQDEIDSFCHAVLTRGVPEVTGEDGLRAMELAQQIQQSMENSARIMMPLEPQVVNR